MQSCGDADVSELMQVSGGSRSLLAGLLVDAACVGLKGHVAFWYARSAYIVAAEVYAASPLVWWLSLLFVASKGGWVLVFSACISGAEYILEEFDAWCI